MLMPPAWLPDLVRSETFNGDWDRYLEAMYLYFSRDFIEDEPQLRRQPVKLPARPLVDGREEVFWHIITREDSALAQRLPDYRRCERIRWPRPIIEHPNPPLVKYWIESEARGSRTLLWFQEIDYVVVLANRSGYYLLWTAYVVDTEHRRNRLLAHYEAYKNELTPPEKATSPLLLHMADELFKAYIENSPLSTNCCW